jgi:hypothetical protein
VEQQVENLRRITRARQLNRPANGGEDYCHWANRDTSFTRFKTPPVQKRLQNQAIWLPELRLMAHGIPSAKVRATLKRPARNNEHYANYRNTK